MSLSPGFRTHLSFFASPAEPHLLTFTSCLKSSLSLGLNFPASVFLSLALRVMYSPSLLLLSPPDLRVLKTNRTQLEHVTPDKKQYTRAEILAMAPPRSSLIDKGHIFNMWALAADNKTGLISQQDLESFQNGTLLSKLAQRRRHGQDADTVLPFARGGPFSVAGHSWLVGKVFGVQVYLKD